MDGPKRGYQPLTNLLHTPIISIAADFPSLTLAYAATRSNVWYAQRNIIAVQVIGKAKGSS